VAGVRRPSPGGLSHDHRDQEGDLRGWEHRGRQRPLREGVLLAAPPAADCDGGYAPDHTNVAIRGTGGQRRYRTEPDSHLLVSGNGGFHEWMVPSIGEH